jgi:hypothetical protein
MSVIGSNILAGASGQGGGYNLTNSLRFRSSASAYLNRTPSVASNRKTWTWSAWVKLGTIAANNGTLFSAGTTSGGSSRFYLRYTGSQFQTGFGSFNLDTTVALFRDPSAWYHVVIAIDTTQATTANRLKIYVNGIQQSVTTDANYSQNDDTAVNNTVSHQIASDQIIPGGYFDGYLAEVNFIDGQALTPSSFGTFNGLGVWQPIRYGGSYGTNGFYLKFTDTTSTTTLGYDSSPNGNNWTTNNISLTAGSTYDSMTDVPTLTSATASNFAVLNPLARTSSSMTVQDGNLTTTQTATGNLYVVPSTMVLPTSGKFYAEFRLTSTVSSGNGGPVFGISQNQTLMNTGYGNRDKTVGYYTAGGNDVTYRNGTNTTGVSGLATSGGDIVQVAIDCATGNVWLGKNNTFYGGTSGVPTAIGNPSAGSNPIATLSASDVESGYVFFVAISDQIQTNGWTVNFGQRPFAYTPPTGFVALNTFNLPTPTIGATAATTANKYMNIALYTGTGSSQSITGLGFQPDWTWIKERNASADHGLYDAVRGVQIQLECNNTGAETTETTGLTAFGSDGFTVGALAQLNTSADTYVAWNWKANGAGVSNTAGTITSTVSASTTAGFSIVTYTGTGANATVGHGLGVAPSMVIVKNRDATDAWQVYHAANTANPETDYLVLNTTAATADAADRWNDTLPTSTVFSIGNGVEVNTSTEKYVAYCFAQIAGYSAFGSYVANGSSDGTFIYCGFRPRFIIVKRSSNAGAPWSMFDTSRNPYNATNLELNANNSNADSSLAAGMDVLSNGFKLRSATDLNSNSGDTFIYMAFAETPLKFSNAR